MDPWYLLKCPSCRATLRIKSEYVHMRGYCPACDRRVEPPIPKPLVMSDKDEPVGLMPQDEVWPEPATLLNKNNEVENTTVTSYTMEQSAAAVAAGISLKKQDDDEDSGGVYSLAYEPDAPKGAGVSRSAEWDQAKAPTLAPPTMPVITPAPKPAEPTPVSPAVATQPPPMAFKTEIDPLFGDEVRVALPATSVPETNVKTPVPAPVAPLAKLAPQEDVTPNASPAPTEDPTAPVIKKKKKKKPELAPIESRPSLDSPTQDTHLYALSEAEVNRIKPDAPPKTLFFDGVFTFPWEGKNLAPWIWLSLGFIVIFLLFALIVYVAQNGGMAAPVGAGALSMASLFLILFNLAYGCACWTNTITYTSAGSRAVDWGTEGWRENVFVFMRIAYYFILAMILSTPLLVFNLVSIGDYLWLLGTLFLFPIFLFSGMASLTFWNFLHGDVIKQVIVKLHLYLLMYALGCLIFFISGVAIYFSTKYAWLSFVAGPVFAAAWLIYGRLLGRMALALQQTAKKKKKKKKKPETEASEESEPAGTASKQEDSSTSSRKDMD